MSGDGQKISIYFSSCPGNMSTVNQQNCIERILQGKQVEFEKLDVTADNNLSKMRELMGDTAALAPQIFKGDIYCGSCGDLEEANECGKQAVYDFLQLPLPDQQGQQSQN